jgi:hypothetical protein
MQRFNSNPPHGVMMGTEKEKEGKEAFQWGPNW